MITLDLPIPFSLNKTRKIDWAAIKNHKKWLDLADALVMQSRQNRQSAIVGPFEAHILVSDSCRNDLDNNVKSVLDYCVRLKMVTDDGPDYLRKFTVEFGNTTEGIRVTLVPFEQEAPFVTGTTRRRIVDHLWKHREGVTTARLVEVVYAGKERGDHRSLWVIIYNANKQLAPHLWRIVSTKGPGSVYRLERIEKPPLAGGAASTSVGRESGFEETRIRH